MGPRNFPNGFHYLRPPTTANPVEHPHHGGHSQEPIVLQSAFPSKPLLEMRPCERLGAAQYATPSPESIRATLLVMLARLAPYTGVGEYTRQRMGAVDTPLAVIRCRASGSVHDKPTHYGSRPNTGDALDGARAPASKLRALPT